MLPDGWHYQTIGDLADVLTGFAFESDKYVEPFPSAVRLLRGDNVTPGAVRWEGAKHFPTPYDESLTRYELEVGDIAIALDRPIIGSGLKLSVLEDLDLPCLLVQRVARVRARAGVSQAFLAHALRSQRFVDHLKGQKTQTAVPHVSPNDVRAYLLATPPQPEQEQIARVLGIWDKAIAATERLLISGRMQKQALLWNLLSDGGRARQKLKPIRRAHASDVFAARSVRRNNGLELLSVMQDVGVVPRSSLDRKVVMPEGSTDGYKLVEPGNFVISLRSFEGGLEYSRYKGLVSPAYTVLTSRLPIADDFYRHYFKSRDFIGRLAVAVIGIRDGKQISYDDFAFLRIPSPPVEEQQRISDVLTSAESIVSEHQAGLEKLRRERQAVMQQLLAGKRRVPLSEQVEVEPA